MNESKSHLSAPKYRADIDGLRAIAVLAVMAYHAFPGRIRGGYVGVDIFFIISGFLISTILFENLDKGTFSFREFYARRIRRIFPSLLLILVACTVAGWFVLLPDEYLQLGRHLAAGAGFSSNFLLWNESGYFDAVAERKPLLHLWSLGIEEQFYIFWPLLLWFARKKRSHFLAAVLGFGLLSFCANSISIRYDQVLTFYAPWMRFWELLLGSGLAWLFLYRPSFGAEIRNKFGLEEKCATNFAGALGMLMMAAAALLFSKEIRFPGFWALLPTLGAALVVANRSSWVNRKIFAHPYCVSIGLFSFPLYLWHWPLISFSHIVEGGIPNPIIRAAALVISFPLAWLTYKVWEKPFRFGKFVRHQTALLVVLVALVGALGWIIYKKRGFPARAELHALEEQYSQFYYIEDLGHPEEAHIMLLGDSHGSQLVPGLKKEFGREASDYTFSGCIPFRDVDRYDSRFVPGTCRLKINQSLDYFESNEKMDLVILASMGPSYLEGTAFKGWDSSRVTGLGVTLEGRPELNRWQAYELGMRATLLRMRQLKKKVVFSIDVPELGFDPQICIGSRPFAIIKRKKMDPCGVTRAENEAREKNYRALIYKVLQDFPEVAVFDPRPMLCDQEWCHARIGEDYLYRDGDHLSQRGSEFVGKGLAEVVRKRLKAPL